MSTTIVIGAGVIGLSCAYSLRRRGEDVIVLDAGQPGGACSSGNTGWIVPSFSTPLPSPGVTLATLRQMLRRESPLFIAPRAIPSLATWLWRFFSHCNTRDYERGVRALAELNHRTIELFDAFAADGVSFEMCQAGVLFGFLGESSAAASYRDLELLARHGYPLPRRLDGAEVRELEPALSSRITAGLLITDDAHVRPESLVSGLARRLTTMGVQVCPEQRVTRFIRRGEQVVALGTTQGEVEGDRFLVAAGAWSRALCDTLGVSLPVEAGKGYSVTFREPPWTVRRPVYLAGAHVACSPFHGALRFAGTMELSGINSRLDQARLESMFRAAAPYLASPPLWSDGDAWVGMRPVTPDGLPIIGRLGRLANVFVATGHAMLGVTLAPATGELIADLMLEGRASESARAFEPARWS